MQQMVCISANPAGARVPITSYTCTQPDQPGFNNLHRCTVSSGLRTCETKGISPDSPAIGGVYVWNGNTNPFVVLDIPQGWCVNSVKMTFGSAGKNITLSLSVHSPERLSNNTDSTMFSIGTEGDKVVVMHLTSLVRGRYLRINMTSYQPLRLTNIEVLGTASRYTFTDHQELA